MEVIYSAKKLNKLILIQTRKSMNEMKVNDSEMIWNN